MSDPHPDVSEGRTAAVRTPPVPSGSPEGPTAMTGPDDAPGATIEPPANPGVATGPAPASLSGAAAIGASPGAAAAAASASPEAGASTAGADLGRRRFFRQFATDVFHTAATVAGAAAALQRGTAEAASAILNPPRGDDDGTSVTTIAEPPVATSLVGTPGGSAKAVQPAFGTAGGVSASTFGRPQPAVGYHSAFRVEGDRIVLVNQHRLPFALVEVECRTAIEVASEIRDLTVVGGPAVAQVAALGLALSANRIRQSRPYARRAILRAAETTLLQARPTSRQLQAAVERVMARYEGIGEFDEDGDRIADAMQDEANAIVFESNDDHGRIADAAAARIPRPTDRPAGILTLGSTGAIAGGQSGTAFGAIQAATYAERDVHVYVLEGRPSLDGGRVTVWELAQAGIPHTLLTDAAAGWLIQGGRIDIVLVGAEAIARNGDVANDAGTYPVAALAARHGIPVIVCAPLAAVDPSAIDGAALGAEERPARGILELSKVPLTLLDTPALNPMVDITPADLVTGWAMEEGLLEAPFADALAGALERRARRLPWAIISALAPAAATIESGTGA